MATTARPATPPTPTTPRTTKGLAYSHIEGGPVLVPVCLPLLCAVLRTLRRAVQCPHSDRPVV